MSNWISVKDREPEHHQIVIAYMSGDYNPDIKIQVLKWWDGDSAEVSHWQPLPKPPEDKP